MLAKLGSTAYRYSRTGRLIRRQVSTFGPACGLPRWWVRRLEGLLLPQAETAPHTKTLGDATGPLLELFPSPLKPMVLVAELAGRQSVELHVVFRVGCGHHDCFRVRCFEKHRLERGQSSRV